MEMELLGLPVFPQRNEYSVLWVSLPFPVPSHSFSALNPLNSLEIPETSGLPPSSTSLAAGASLTSCSGVEPASCSSPGALMG